MERAPVNTPRPRSSAARLTFVIAAAFFFALFFALGTWQLYRLQWKLDLIERVNERVHAAPVAIPEPGRWPQVTAASDEYRHVSVRGVYLPAQSARVQALTVLGSGWWVITPLRTEDGHIVLVNRGFVPADTPKEPAPQVGKPITVTGLLRISEPEGRFLRTNDPAHELWYSRDVEAIAKARGLEGVAPFFIDADAMSTRGDTSAGDGLQPIGGLTVVSFPNNHLVYALTWYALALMAAGAVVWVLREQRNARGDHRSD
jgi:surfeit locus 1 family protein